MANNPNTTCNPSITKILNITDGDDQTHFDPNKAKKFLATVTLARNYFAPTILNLCAAPSFVYLLWFCVSFLFTYSGGE